MLLDPGKSYYRAVKQLGCPGSKKEWSVRDLFPGESAEVAGNEILDYFSKVGGEGQPPIIPPQSDPVPANAGLGHFDVPRVAELLKDHKKVRSTVDGDPMPHLVKMYPELFTVPVATIFNAVNSTGRWPVKWKKEHITVIPKNPKPDGLRECRNISCTPYLSKVLEGVLLKKLRQELSPDDHQFGGEKGCGAEHMIVEIWDKILEAMDNGDNAACLLGLDFEKAFNRMDHSHCISQLKALGASEESILLVRSFLDGRKMSVTVDGVHCGTKKIVRGSPQGSVLGCLLYCVTTQLLAGGGALPDAHELAVPGTPERTPADPLCHSPTLHVASAGWWMRFFPGSESDESEGVNFWDSDEQPSLDHSRGSWEMIVGDDGIITFKYVDDTTAFEAVPMSSAV